MDNAIMKKVLERISNNYVFFCDDERLLAVELTQEVFDGDKVLTKDLTIDFYQQDKNILGKVVD